MNMNKMNIIHMNIRHIHIRMNIHEYFRVEYFSVPANPPAGPALQTSYVNRQRNWQIRSDSILCALYQPKKAFNYALSENKMLIVCDTFVIITGIWA